MNKNKNSQRNNVSICRGTFAPLSYFSLEALNSRLSTTKQENNTLPTI